MAENTMPAYNQGRIYPFCKRKKKKVETIEKDETKFVSGCYEGKLSNTEAGDEAELEVKIDVDKMREHSNVLNIVSGSIVKSKGEFLRIGREHALYFRSFGTSLVYKKTVDASFAYDREIFSTIACTRNDGEKFIGKIHIFLTYLREESNWKCRCEVYVGNESATFQCSRLSMFFRKIAIDIDYVDRVVWPTIYLSEYKDVPIRTKDLKLDPITVFENAGVKLIYDARNSDRIIDPTPHSPWTKNDMYEVMMANFDEHQTAETLWCMMANKPPDEQSMGFSFDTEDYHGFGLFLEHKSFDGLEDKTHESYIYAKRKFLHYIVHECGHSLGLIDSLEAGKYNDLTWMNYAWRYDSIYGPGEFYRKFAYTFTKEELEVIRHSPNRKYRNLKVPDIEVSSYGLVKALPAKGKVNYKDYNDSEEVLETKLSLRIKVRVEPYRLNELIDVEVRIKNEGEVPAMVERDLSIDGHYLSVYITYPNGKMKKCKSFVSTITGTTYSDPVTLYPSDSGEDRYTQLITVGEEACGSEFNTLGTYKLQAVYDTGYVRVNSNSVNVEIVKNDFKSISIGSTINKAFVLGSVSYGHVQTAAKEWNKMVSLGDKEKKLFVPKLKSIADEFLAEGVRVVSKEGNQKVVQTQSVSLNKAEFLSKTDDLLRYYHVQGVKEDNINYKELVMARAKVLTQVDVEKADNECNQLIYDLISRGVKYSAITSVMKEYEKLKKIKSVGIDTTSSHHYQKRVEEILGWYPKKKLQRKHDLSGLGFNTLLSHFDDDHIYATSKIVRLLFNKLDETNDLNAVLDYADNLQRSYQVNHHVLQWSVEIFIIHSKIARKNGIRYPLPQDMEKEQLPKVTMPTTIITGTPQESWMHYWRSDADLNYHHRHWHGVYVVSKEIGDDADWFGRWRNYRPELERQGELFTYMHQQILSRYDAERRSWGLPYVKAWRFDEEETLGFNIGFEFHNDPQNTDFFPRPPASWPIETQQKFSRWEEAYCNSVDDGFLPEVCVAGKDSPIRLPIDFNLSGHVLESSSKLWRPSIGNFHNEGHNIFATNQLEEGQKSYMYDVATAMRDHVFYRWHKKVDNLWQYFNETQEVEVAVDAPPIRIRASDIVLKKSAEPLDKFISFQSDLHTSDEMTTFLGPPLKKFESSYKISHDPFYYHIRFMRTAPGDLNLTFRIFICQENEINNRIRWIEMDKFVYRLPSEQDSAVIIRADRHSSVIKRIPEDMQDNVETSVSEVGGFCECGWPYNMLLPRGTAEGENWRVCVFASDNNIDNIRIRSSCGSLSFCGASGQPYPDGRPMGYPFTTSITLNSEPATITEMFDSLSNTAMSSFVIKNNIRTSLSTNSLVNLWTPWIQLRIDDGTNTEDSHTQYTEFRSNHLVGRFRVLIDHKSMIKLKSPFSRVRIRFHGRGHGHGSYKINNATVAWRSRSSLDVLPGGKVSVLTVNGKTSFDVIEQGVITDEVDIGPGGEDLFVTFTLDSPGCHLPETTSTWVIKDPVGESANSQNWNNLNDKKEFSAIYCVGGVLVETPPP